MQYNVSTIKTYTFTPTILNAIQCINHKNIHIYTYTCYSQDDLKVKINPLYLFTIRWWWWNLIEIKIIIFLHNNALEKNADLYYAYLQKRLLVCFKQICCC